MNTLNSQPVSKGEVKADPVHHAVTKVIATWAKDRWLSALALVEDNENVTIVQWYIEKRACLLKAETEAVKLLIFQINAHWSYQIFNLLNKVMLCYWIEGKTKKKRKKEHDCAG